MMDIESNFRLISSPYNIVAKERKHKHIDCKLHINILIFFCKKTSIILDLLKRFTYI